MTQLMCHRKAFIVNLVTSDMMSYPEHRQASYRNKQRLVDSLFKLDDSNQLQSIKYIYGKLQLIIYTITNTL